MNNVNIAEILQNVTEEMKISLYSPLLGVCLFDKVIDDGNRIKVISKNGADFTFHSDGSFFKGIGECMLFPTIKKTWDGWQMELFDEGCFITSEITGSTLLYKGCSSGQDSNGMDIQIHFLDSCRFASDNEIQCFMWRLSAVGLDYNKETKSIKPRVHYAAPKDNTDCCNTGTIKFTVNKNMNKEFKLTKIQYNVIVPFVEYIIKNK